jgi:hypothetical protein
MDIALVDYTKLYYQEVLKTAIPPVVSGKFVQIRHESTEYLIFSPKEFTKYHANIVERFCFDNGLEGTYDATGKRYDITDHAWSVTGGGKYEVNTERKTIRLYDDSMAYGKFVNQNLTDKVLSFAEFKGYAVSIE